LGENEDGDGEVGEYRVEVEVEEEDGVVAKESMKVLREDKEII